MRAQGRRPGRERPESSARAAFGYRAFRTVFVGSFVANVGTWMRHVVLMAFAYELTESAGFVGQITFVYLAPVLVLGLPGGLLVDRLDRRKLLVGLAVTQMLLSFALARVVVGENVTPGLLLVVTAGFGVCNALYMPAYMALLPGMVERRHLAGAISLMSAQQNATRVIGPVAAGACLVALEPWHIFVIAGLAMIFVIVTLVRVPIASVERARSEPLKEALLAGFATGRHNRVVGRALVTITVFSFACLYFVNQLPVIAEENLGLEATSPAYGVFYACFGLGAVLGALSNGTIFSRVSQAAVVRRGLVAFAFLLAAFALVRGPIGGSILVIGVGASYLAATTALTSSFQVELEDHERGRLSTLWTMAFAGTVGASSLMLGPIADAVGSMAVLLAGAAIALPLAWYADLRPGRRAADVRVADPIGPCPAEPVTLQPNATGTT
ncbi:MAG TPA: MFS transporter [Acidimicrobiales bacterium]|nr:MFS transporter [Acidimicrobiales bacterium]